MKSVDLLCKLCRDSDDIRVSHVLPRFLGKYLKETSATGFLTAIDQNGRPTRSQDLYKRKLLCGRCESILNEVETFFANMVFHPFKKGELKTIPVDDRFARFAVSVSLRVLWIMRLVEHPLVERWEVELGELETEWRSFLLRTPDFIMGSLITEARPTEDWAAISSQNRWSGVIFQGDPDARVFPAHLDARSKVHRAYVYPSRRYGNGGICRRKSIVIA